MLERYLFLGYSDGVISPEKSCGAAYLAAAKLGNAVFLYAEAENGDFSPETAIDGDLRLFPDGKRWARLANVFYYNLPENPQDWLRCRPSAPQIRVAKLKYDGVSPYVFYHYQLQEENRKRLSRYYLIGLFGNMLVSYDETPHFPGRPRCGCLKTNNTPAAKWREKMNGFFESDWVDAEIIFKKDYLGQIGD